MRNRVGRPVRALRAGAALLLLPTMLTMLTITTSSAQADSREPDPSERELIAQAETDGPQPVIVEFASMQERNLLVRELRSSGDDGFELKRSFDHRPLVSGWADGGVLADLTSELGVVKVHENALSYPDLGSALSVTGADVVHDRGLTGSGQTVAIIDSGVDADHPAFDGRVVAEACFSSNEGGRSSLCPNEEETQTGPGAADPKVDRCLNDADDNICGHGTHVAGIAASAQTGDTPGDGGDGVAPSASIIAIQVFHLTEDGDIASRADDQIAAMQHVRELAGDHTIAATNMSISGGDPQTEACDDDVRAPEIESLVDMGIVHVQTPGNNGWDDSVRAPGCVTAAVTVGNTADDDTPVDSGNRGPLLDVFAPGDQITSTEPDDDYGERGGTSMAAPHVTGGFALLSERFPGETPQQLLDRLLDTGVPVTYDSGDDSVTTPRIDLAAAVPARTPTDVSAGGPYETDEGAPVRLNASGNDVETFAWDFDDDGAFDDATGASPTFDLVGQDGVYPVTVQATGGGGTVTDTTTVTVHNVPPTVEFTLDAPVDDPKPEGSTVTVTGRVTDPGWLDELSATINFGPGTGETVDLEGVLTNDPPQAVFTFETAFDYGDVGDYTVEVCGADDDEIVCEDQVASILNVDPAPRIDKSDAVDTPEGPTLVVGGGEDVPLSARVTDPGSDDLRLRWYFGQPESDGSPDREVTSLVNPPDPDPPLSPSVQPRDITDETATAYAKPCVYRVELDAADDDGGVDSDNVHVVVQNNGLLATPATVWYTEYLLLPPLGIGRETLECYLDIADHMSGVLGQVTDVGGIEQARAVLRPRLLPTPEEAFDRQLLTAWLNFAHGPFGIDEDLDTRCNLHTDAMFHDVVRTAEAVRLDPDATEADLKEQTRTLTKLNLCNPL